MEISELKSRLDIIEVAKHLGIHVNKDGKAICPFHADKNPSLQFSKEKQIATCFSGKCNAGTMDVVELVKKYKAWELPEVLSWLGEMIGENVGVKSDEKKKEVQGDYLGAVNYADDFEIMQSSFLNSSIAKEYAQNRVLEVDLLQLGYNAFKQSRFNYLRGCVVFPLKDKEGKIVSLYGRSVKDLDKATDKNGAATDKNGTAPDKNGAGKHYYTANRKGLYPAYPVKETQKIILTESVIDCASLLPFLKLSNDYPLTSILALYGTNGLTTEHLQALQKLPNLQEIILFFDGDDAGKQANEKQGKYLQEVFPEVKITVVHTPDNEDINSIAITRDMEVFKHLLNNRKSFSFSMESTEPPFSSENNAPTHAISPLNTTNPHNIIYPTDTAIYYIKGGIRKDLDSLKVSLVIEALESKQKSRNKLDLYEDKQTEKISREAGEKLCLRSDLIEQDLTILTDLLEQYRESTVFTATTEQENKKVIVSGAEKEKCLTFLQQPNLIQKINDLIGKSGVVGEENNRIFLFGIASSYKMPDTLHALIQGSSGSGKTHLLASMMHFMPHEDTISLTRVTESSLYNYGKYELQNKLIGMEDYDGLEEKAEFAFRELQSKGMISTSTSGKNETTGEISGFVKEVYGPIASLSATTKGEIYEDNMSRCFLVAVDESEEQTQKIIQYQNRRAAGLINENQEKEIRDFLRNCIRILQPYKVVNPFADKIQLPKEAHKIRRLNDLFQSYVKQITLINQFQRKKDNQGRLITQKEDIQITIEIMFDSIILKVDELDGSLRGFYEKLKAYVLKEGKEYEFSRFEIRKALQVSKTQQHSYINQLLNLEYIQQIGGYANRGFKYKIQYWDNNQKLRKDVRTYLNDQIEKL